MVMQITIASSKSAKKQKSWEETYTRSQKSLDIYGVRRSDKDALSYVSLLRRHFPTFVIISQPGYHPSPPLCSLHFITQPRLEGGNDN